MCMSRFGEVSKGILIFACCYYLYIALIQAVTGQLALSLFMLVGFMIPFSYVAYGYFKGKKKTKSSNLQCSGSDQTVSAASS